MNRLVAQLMKRIGLGPPDTSAGELLQFAKGTKDTTAILGLDLGTSSAKATIQLPYVPGAPALAVPFAPRQKVPYLVRTVPTRSSADSADEAGEYAPRSNPKVDLLVNPESDSAQARVVVILSRLMRRARRWFLEDNRKSYGAFRLEWQANIGVPSSGYGDRRIEKVLNACGRAAWELSKSPETPDQDGALEALQAYGDSPSIPVSTMPEIAAAAESYARSIFARDGMHVMLDVGASTLDICAFMLQPKNPSRPFGPFSAVVEHLGVAILHDDRVRAVIEHGDLPGRVAMGDPRDPAFRVPEQPVGYVSGRRHPPDYLLKLDSEFQEQCALALRTVLAGLFEMNPYGRWKDGLPVLMTGGGGQMEFYRTIVTDIRVKKSSCTWHRVSIADPVQPSNLQPSGLSGDMVNRLLVAHGLSVPGGGGMTIVDPATFSKLPPPPHRRLDDRYVGKEMV